MSLRTAARAFAVVAFFTLFAGEAIRDALSWYGYAAWAGVVFIGCLVVFVGAMRDGSAVRQMVEAESGQGASTRPLRGPLSRRGGGARRVGRRWPAAVVLLGAYIAWAVVSLSWSAYPLGTLTGLAALLVVTFVATTLVLTLPWVEIARALNLALFAILVLSLFFEMSVALIARRPILPNFPIDVVPGQKIPDAFYWSRALLFEGGRIQGIVGNANLLGFIALLALILSGCLLATRALSRWLGIASVTLAALELALTRSSTVIAATVVSAVVLALVTLLRREPRANMLARRRLGGGLAAMLLVGAVVAVIQYRAVLSLMGKSDDLTGRFDIWSTVAGLIAQRPILGWGWIGYWLPWIPPFGHLAERNGVVYLQAHNAFLDVLFQLGIVGVVVFVALIVGVAIRVGRGGVRSAASPAPNGFPIGVLLPTLLLTALLTQSVAESRLLYEGNWAVFCVLALATASPLRRSARALPNAGAGATSD